MQISEGIPLKLVLVGDQQIGKTTLIHTYINKKYYQPTVSKIKFDYQTIQTTFNDQQYSIQIWENIGDQFKDKQIQFIVKNADGIMLCFDLSKEFNLQSIHSWMEILINSCPSHCIIVLVGTKSDLPYNQSKLDNSFHSLQNQYKNLKELILVSSLNQLSVNQLFQTTIDLSIKAIHQERGHFFLESVFLPTIYAQENSILQQMKRKKKKNCC